MTNYNLSDFKKWILANQSQILRRKIAEGTFKADDLKTLYTGFEQDKKRWDKVLQGIEDSTLRKTVVDEWRLSLANAKLNLFKTKLSHWTKLLSK